MKVLLRNVRLSFPDLFEAKQYQGTGPAYYRATFLLPEGSEDIKNVNAAIKQVATEKWQDKAGAKLNPIKGNPQKFCFQDGNNRDYNGYAGNWALAAVRNEKDGRPVIVDRNKAPLQPNDGKIYSGCYVNAVVDIWADGGNFGPAIRATLVSVQFVKDGESFGGASRATADDFEELPFEDEFGASEEESFF